MSEIITLSQAAELLKMHATTVSRQATKGQIPGWKFGSQWRFDRAVLEGLIRGDLQSRTQGESHEKTV